MDFIGTPVSGTAPHKVKFINTSTGNILNFVWDFGDGASANGVKPSHKFDVGEFTSKTFTVNLTVLDNLGAHHTTYQQITVNYK